MKRTVTFGAVGDIAFSRTVGRDIAKHGFDWPFAKMLPHLRKADLLCGNMESITLPAEYPDDQIDPAGLVGKLDGTPALQAGGFDVMVLANNHVLDGGQVGMFHTRRIIEDLGIATVGVGATQREARTMRTLERGGIRFGFLAYCEDSNYSLTTTGPCHAFYRLGDVLTDVAANRDKVDVLVVTIHADLEFSETPSLPRRDASRLIAQAGASILIQHHPHVPQGVEMVNGCLIAYSLGNFYFPAHSMPYMKDNGPHTAHSFLLLAEVSKKGVQSFTRVPFAIAESPNERPAPLQGKARLAMLRYLAQLDLQCQDDDLVRQNWREISVRHLKTYLQRVMDKGYSQDALLDDVLGRLLFVQENRLWVEEAFSVIRDNWASQAQRVDPLHRPSRYFAKKFGY